MPLKRKQKNKMGLQDTIKSFFDACVKLDYKGPSHQHPIIYLNAIKNIIGDNKKDPSKVLMDKIEEIAINDQLREEDDDLLSNVAKKGLGLTVAVSDLQDACQQSNWIEAKELAAKLQWVSENGLGLIEALIELSLQDFNRLGVFVYHLQRANAFNQNKDNNWPYAVCILNELKKNKLPNPHKGTELIFDIKMINSDQDLIDYSAAYRLWEGDYIRSLSFRRELSYWLGNSKELQDKDFISTIDIDSLERYRNNRGNFFIQLAEKNIDDLDYLLIIESLRFFTKNLNRENFSNFYLKLKNFKADEKNE